jgi:heme/copper-type cytochrome/quinol oxidase subunit 2
LMKNQSQETVNPDVSKKRELSIWAALLPVVILIILLLYNVFFV